MSRTTCVFAAILVAVAVGVRADQRVLLTMEQRHPYPIPIASASVSSDGRFVAFDTMARLVPADGNAESDIYVLTIESGTVELVSIDNDGMAMGDSSSTPRLSGDGRYVVFESATPGPQRLCRTVFLRDRHRRTTRAIAVAWDSPARIACAERPAISSDGNWVAFESFAEDLVEGIDANGDGNDVYVLHTVRGEIARVSVTTDDAQSPFGSSYDASLSADGRFIAFTSTACLDVEPGMSPNSGSCTLRVYVRDLAAGVTRGVMAAGNRRPNGPTYSAALSEDGRHVAFVSTATNLAGDTNKGSDVYTYDLDSGSIELITRTPEGKAGNGWSARPVISETGRFVAFDSTASNLICTRRCAPRDLDHNLVQDVFLLDRERGSMQRLSQDATEPWWEPSRGPAMDAAALLVTFSSRHAMDADDVRADFDLFVVSRRTE